MANSIRLFDSNSNCNARFDLRSDSNAIGRFAGRYFKLCFCPQVTN